MSRNPPYFKERPTETRAVPATPRTAAGRFYVQRLRDDEKAFHGMRPVISTDRVAEALDAVLAIEAELGGQHVDRFDCWCGPTKNYEDPVTGNQVWVHREVAS